MRAVIAVACAVWVPRVAALVAVSPTMLHRPVVASVSLTGLHMSGLVLTEENVQSVLADCQIELGTMFGSNAQSLKVGITGVRAIRHIKS